MDRMWFENSINANAYDKEACEAILGDDISEEDWNHFLKENKQKFEDEVFETLRKLLIKKF